MEKKKYTQGDMEMWIKHLISELPKHDTPSEDTMKEIQQIHKAINEIPKNMGCAAHAKRIEALEEAIYGDEDKQIVGMKQQVNEMHAFFTGAKGMNKFIVSIFGALVIISGGLIALKKAAVLFFK